MSEQKPLIYLDSHATTPVDPRVFEEMKPYFTEKFGNASSLDHPYGYDASISVQLARETIANAIGANNDEIILKIADVEILDENYILDVSIDKTDCSQTLDLAKEHYIKLEQYEKCGELDDIKNKLKDLFNI